MQLISIASDKPPQTPPVSGSQGPSTLFRLRSSRNFFCLCLLLSPVIFAASAVEGAENTEQVEVNLAVVHAAIEDIQGWLTQANARHGAEEIKLRDAEKDIATIIQSAHIARLRLGETELDLDLLRTRISQLEQEKSHQGALLGQSIRAAYLAGELSTLKLLLNQQDLSRSARLLHYHRLFAASRIKQVQAFQHTIDDIASANVDLESRVVDLIAQQTELEQNLLALETARAQREQALSELTANINSRSRELKRLESDRAELGTLLQQIAEAMERVQSIANLPPFIGQRGKLPLPADGPVISRFGSRFLEGALTRQGITLAVAEGTPVRAVHPGRIVFSDWLRGSGLLIIVDHGDGYMSLYGANQALSKSAGDWVNAGDILATSGVRGDGTVGVYFEIRHHGTARNPATWLQN